MTRDQQSIYEVVITALVETARDNGQVVTDIALDAVLTVDSMTVMQLVVALEDALELREFPIQEWIDEQAGRGREAFTIGGLVNKCMQVCEVAERSAQS